MICNCTKNRKKYPLKTWRIVFNRYTPKFYSRIYCLKCKRIWLSNSEYTKNIETLTKTLF